MKQSEFNDLFIKQQIRLNRTTGSLFEDLNNRVVDLERRELYNIVLWICAFSFMLFTLFWMVAK